MKGTFNKALLLSVLMTPVVNTGVMDSARNAGSTLRTWGSDYVVSPVSNGASAGYDWSQKQASVAKDATVDFYNGHQSEINGGLYVGGGLAALYVVSKTPAMVRAINKAWTGPSAAELRANRLFVGANSIAQIKTKAIASKVKQLQMFRAEVNRIAGLSATERAKSSVSKFASKNGLTRHVGVKNSLFILTSAFNAAVKQKDGYFTSPAKSARTSLVRKIDQLINALNRLEVQRKNEGWFSGIRKAVSNGCRSCKRYVTYKPAKKAPVVKKAKKAAPKAKQAPKKTAKVAPKADTRTWKEAAVDTYETAKDLSVAAAKRAFNALKDNKGKIAAVAALGTGFGVEHFVYGDAHLAAACDYTADTKAWKWTADTAKSGFSKVGSYLPSLGK